MGPHATPATHGRHQLLPAGVSVNFLSSVLSVLQEEGALDLDISSGMVSGEHGLLRFGAASCAVRRLVPPCDASAPLSGSLLP